MTTKNKDLQTPDMDPSTALELQKSNERYEQVREDIEAFAQGTTDFQIEVFIGGGEGPVSRFPCHAYRHLLAQVRPLISEIRRVAILRERKLRQIAAIQESMKASDLQDDPAAGCILSSSDGGVDCPDLDLLELEFAVEELDTDLKGKWATYATYDKLLTHLREKYGPFTNERLQADEPAYWQYRLSKQMLDSREGAISGYGGGNLNSLRLAIQGSPLPDSDNRIPALDPTPENLLHIMEGGRPQLE